MYHSQHLAWDNNSPRLIVMKTCHRVHVALGKKERHQITAMLTKGRESARVLRRALILRQLDQGQTGVQVARNVGMARKTVRAIARCCEEEGLESALYFSAFQNRTMPAKQN